MRKTTLFLLTLTMALLSAVAAAGVPGQMNYQGTLTDDSGVVLDTTISMTFTIYDDSTAGATLWTEAQPGVAVTGGLFNVLLGSVNPVSDTVFNAPDRWLGIQVGGDPELVPRQQIMAAGYAFRAAESDTADYARNALGGSDGDWTIVGDDLSSAVPGNVGIGTASPEFKLSLDGDGAIIAKGTFGAGDSLLTAGTGARLIWYPRKAAFRAGQASSASWNEANIGDYSAAFGYDTEASGDYALAAGFGSEAAGEASAALGRDTDADGKYSIATGQYSRASGLSSTAMGTDCLASGLASFAMGYNAEASGHQSVALGYNVIAGTADNTMILGSSQGPGYFLFNNIENSLMVGFNSDIPTLFIGPSAGTGTSGNVGIGTSSPAAKLDIQGTVNVGVDATGHDVNFYGAESGGRLFWDQDKMALRTGIDSDGTHWAADSVGQYSVAMGYDSKAMGNASTALGWRSFAGTTGSFAAGYGTRAEGGNSTALGYYSSARSLGSIAIGYRAISEGQQSTAIGYESEARGKRSIAIGRLVTAVADSCMVIGSGIDNDYTLWNYIPHSLFVGFKTSVPTLFVGGTDHRVGIGTDSPEAKLHVEGVIEVDQKIQADDSGGLELASDEGTTRLFIRDNGNVGIWTTSPAHALHVAGHEMIQGPDGFNSNGEQATLYLGDTNKYLRATYGGNTTLYSNDPLLIRTGADAEQLFLGTGGRVGIGTSTPGYKLDVNGDINVSGSYNVKKGGTNYTHPDYVFEPDYELMPLGELKEHVFAEKSLPNVISADDVRKNDGFKMDELLVQMLEKLEEQTLYIFQLEERIAALEQRR